MATVTIVTDDFHINSGNPPPSRTHLSFVIFIVRRTYNIYCISIHFYVMTVLTNVCFSKITIVNTKQTKCSTKYITTALTSRT